MVGGVGAILELMRMPGSVGRTRRGKDQGKILGNP